MNKKPRTLSQSHTRAEYFALMQAPITEKLEQILRKTSKATEPNKENDNIYQQPVNNAPLTTD